MNNGAQAQMQEELEEVFDGMMDVQPVRNGQFNSKARFLTAKTYQKLLTFWKKVPHGMQCAELIAFLEGQISNPSIGQTERAKYIAVKEMLEVVPRSADYNFVLVYLQLRSKARKQILTQQQKDLLGGEGSRALRLIVKTDTFVTFGDRTGTKTEHNTAMDLLDTSAQPPQGTYAGIAKDVQFAQKLARDVHERSKPMVTMETAVAYMRRYHQAVSTSTEGMVEREYRNLVAGATAEQEETVTPLKRAWAATGGAVGSALAGAAKKLAFGK